MAQGAKTPAVSGAKGPASEDKWAKLTMPKGSPTGLREDHSKDAPDTSSNYDPFFADKKRRKSSDRDTMAAASEIVAASPKPQVNEDEWETDDLGRKRRKVKKAVVSTIYKKRGGIQ